MSPRLPEIESGKFDFRRVSSRLASSGQSSRGFLPRSDWLALPGFARALGARPFPVALHRSADPTGIPKRPQTPMFPQMLRATQAIT